MRLLFQFETLTMKPLIPLMFAAILAVSGCAGEPAVKSATEAEHHEAAAEHDCTAGSTPSNRCAETISSTFDGPGVLWITWANNDRIYVQSSVDKGLSFSEPMPVNTVAEKVEAKGEYRPKIKLDGKGNIYITWTQKLEGRHSGHIRFSRSTDGGRHFSAPVTVNNNLDNIGHRFDSMAVGKNGEIFVAWLDARDVEAAKKAGKPFDGSSLYYSWSDDDGAHFYPNKRIAAHTCQCCRLGTEIAPDNTPVVTWRHVFDGGIRDHALVKFADWNTPGDTHRVGIDNWKIDACPHHGPGLSIADSGAYHAVWFSGSATNPGLFYARSTDEGKHFSAPINFAKEGASHPHVLALGSEVRIVWQAFDGTHSAIKLIKSADSGKTWSQPETIAQSDQAVDQPFLIGDGRKFYLSWKAQHRDFQLLAVD